ELLAIAQGELQNGDAKRHEAFEFGVRDQSNFPSFAQRRGIFQSRLVMSGSKGDGFVEEGHRQHVLDADVGNFSIVDYGCFVGGEPNFSLPDLAGVEGMLLAENFKRVERGLDGRTDWPF